MSKIPSNLDLKIEISSWVKKGKLLESLERENISLRHQLAAHAKENPLHDDVPAKRAQETAQVLMSSNAAVRSDIFLLMEEQRRLLILLNELGDVDEQDFSSHKSSLTEKTRKLDEKKGAAYSDMSIEDEIHSHLSHSLVHLGISEPMEALNPDLVKEVQEYWEEKLSWERKNATSTPQEIEFTEGIVKSLNSNMAFMDEVLSSLSHDGKFDMKHALSIALEDEALDNLGFSLYSVPGREYPFDEEDCETNILYVSNAASSPRNLNSGNGNSTTSKTIKNDIDLPIKAATLIKIIEKLTLNTTADLNLRFVFLLTYQSYTSTLEVLDLLECRYHVPYQPNMVPSELMNWQRSKVAPIQIKVFSILKYWISEHFEDFSNDPAATQRLKEVVKGMQANASGPWAKTSTSYLIDLIEKREKGDKLTFDIPQEKLKPLIRVNITYREFEQSFLEQPEEEIARQITLMDFDRFKRIHSRECLNQNWSKHKHLAPNVLKMIEGFNRMTNWVQIEILSQSQIGKRVLMLKKFIKIAEHLKALNNYNSLYAIHVALHSNSIFRLKKTWAVRKRLNILDYILNFRKSNLFVIESRREIYQLVREPRRLIQDREKF